MKYFFDTEFIEGPQSIYCIDDNRPVAQIPNTIELISIGIVNENDERLYLISKDFNIRDAWYRYDVINDERVYWVRENVLKPLFEHFLFMKEEEYTFNLDNFITLLIEYGHTEKYIKDEIIKFIGRDKDIEFYSYFGDYDWVVFCWLFGKMIDLPNKFPKYSKDLAQIRDEVAKKLFPELKLRTALTRLKEMAGYPENVNEHQAIDDAIWNKKLYNFLMVYYG